MKLMKQLAAVMSGIVMILLLLSCGSVDPSKKYPNMIANVDPFAVGTAEAQFDRFFSSKVNKVEIQAFFHPRLNMVSLEFRHQFLRYRQFWDEQSRKQFAASLELYKRDFEDRKLIDNHRKTRAVYGNVKGYLEWEASKYTKTRISNPTIEIGYRFKENSAFFSTLMRSAKEVISDDDSSTPIDSQQISMYLTRSQADEIARIFDQARLLELLRERTSVILTEPAEADAPADTAPKAGYREFGDK
jgi:hypothetical protein